LRLTSVGDHDGEGEHTEKDEDIETASKGGLRSRGPYARRIKTETVAKE